MITSTFPIEQPPKCKKCGKIIQDAFVFLEPETDDLDVEDLEDIVNDNDNAEYDKPIVKVESYTIKKIPKEPKKIVKTAESFATFNSQIKKMQKYSSLIADGLRSDDLNEWIELCFLCNDRLLLEIELLIKEAEKENDSYKEFIVQEKERPKDNTKEIYSENEQLKEEEKSLRRFMQRMDTEKSKLDSELQVLYQERNLLENQEEKYWSEFSQYQYHINLAEDEYQAYNNKYKYVELKLKELESRNVYQDTFYIDNSDKIGTINNLRLGRLTDILVPWEEINAAWGQASLLLYIIAKHVNFEFSKYRLRPKGSRSTIHGKNDDVKELYGSDDLGFGSWFSTWGFGSKTNSKFDEGMVAYLTCLGELLEYAQKKGKIKIPYSVSYDRIGDSSIKMQGNTEELWTKSLKCVLTDLNHLLAWFSSHPKDKPIK